MPYSHFNVNVLNKCVKTICLKQPIKSILVLLFSMNKQEYFEKDFVDGELNYSISGVTNTPFSVKHILNLSDQMQHHEDTLK